MELTKNFYFMRYSSAFPSSYFYMSADHPIAGFFSMQKYVSGIVIEQIEKNPGIISVYANKMKTLLDEISA